MDLQRDMKVKWRGGLKKMLGRLSENPLLKGLLPCEESNLGKWNHTSIDRIGFYGDTRTYEMGAEFLKDMDLVEDWGCGRGGFRAFCKSKRYRGIDGSPSRFADEVVDLARYTSRVDGIFMRHVLEHNHQWRKVLQNAVASCSKKMCLVLFTPFAEKTGVIAINEKCQNVPDIAFRKKDLIRCFSRLKWSVTENIPTDTQYRAEHIFFIEKKH